ncbi:MAG: SCO family protein, partial [Planctomycetota bacterium]
MVEKDGRLVPASATPAPERIEVPQRPLNDGASEPWLTRFVLTERSGRKMGSEELRGQPYVAGFFFTTCPSICVRQNGRIKELQEEFRGQPVRFVSISCDPEIDTPEVLTQYAERFDADPEQWLFFTGDMKYIRRVGSEFFWLPVERRGHPERFALVDAEGKVFGLYQW